MYLCAPHTFRRIFPIKQIHRGLFRKNIEINRLLQPKLIFGQSWRLGVKCQRDNTISQTVIPQPSATIPQQSATIALSHRKHYKRKIYSNTLSERKNIKIGSITKKLEHFKKSQTFGMVWDSDIKDQAHLHRKHYVNMLTFPFL